MRRSRILVLYVMVAGVCLLVQTYQLRTGRMATHNSPCKVRSRRWSFLRRSILALHACNLLLGLLVHCRSRVESEHVTSYGF
jgi:hypothetical protein